MLTRGVSLSNASLSRDPDESISATRYRHAGTPDEPSILFSREAHTPVRDCTRKVAQSRCRRAVPSGDLPRTGPRGCVPHSFEAGAVRMLTNDWREEGARSLAKTSSTGRRSSSEGRGFLPGFAEKPACLDDAGRVPLLARSRAPSVTRSQDASRLEPRCVHCRSGPRPSLFRHPAKGDDVRKTRVLGSFRKYVAGEEIALPSPVDRSRGHAGS